VSNFVKCFFNKEEKVSMLRIGGMTDPRTTTVPLQTRRVMGNQNGQEAWKATCPFLRYDD